MKKIIRRVAALVIGLGLGAVALAGLETVTHISDLNSSWPLGSDLASTSDDHIRNIKVALKTDFPNINSAVTATPTQLNQLTNNTFSTNRVIVNAPSSGDTISATALGTNYVLTLNGASSNPVYMRLIDGKTGTRPWWISIGDAGTGIFSLHDATRGADVLTANTTGDITITAPSSGTAFTLNGVANADAFSLVTPNTASQSFGLRIQSGTNSTDYGLRVVNAANSLEYFRVRGDGAIQAGGPTAASLVDMTPDTGTFTATMTGGSTSPTCTARWTRIGNLVMLEICSATATSNATSFTYTGLPAAVQPTVTQHIPAAASAYENNSATLPNGVEVVVTASSGTITFWMNGASTGWTAVGIKGITTTNTVSYLLN